MRSLFGGDFIRRCIDSIIFTAINGFPRYFCNTCSLPGSTLNEESVIRVLIEQALVRRVNPLALALLFRRQIQHDQALIVNSLLLQPLLCLATVLLKTVGYQAADSASR